VAACRPLYRRILRFVRWAALCGLSLLLVTAVAGPKTPGASLPVAVDLQADANLARQEGKVLIVLFSRSDCSYCETVRRDYLKPLLGNSPHRPHVLVRQVNQDSRAGLVGWDGKRTTHAAFAQREKIKLVPVVAFYGEQGKKLADPIIGARIPDFYMDYLETAITSSLRALPARN
jgi:thioredoxin-related protein